MNGAFRQEAEKGVPHARRALFHFASPEEGDGLTPISASGTAWLATTAPGPVACGDADTTREPV